MKKKLKKEKDELNEMLANGDNGKSLKLRLLACELRPLRATCRYSFGPM